MRSIVVFAGVPGSESVVWGGSSALYSSISIRSQSERQQQHDRGIGQ